MFCESCGQSISDHVSRCPHCGESTGVAVSSGQTAVAAVAVRAPQPKPAGQSRSSGLTRAEQTVYFRLARGFSWFLLIVITVAMVLVAIRLIPVLTQFVGTSTGVSASDLTQAMSSPRAFGSEEENELNPAEMAQLDQAAYEIIQLLPAEMRPSGSVDYLRGQIKNSVGNLSNERKEQMTFLQELRDDLRAIPEAQRAKAFGSYFGVKSQKIQLDRAKKEKAKESLVLLGSSMLSGVALLTFITMILVLMSIERNTRSATA